MLLIGDGRNPERFKFLVVELILKIKTCEPAGDTFIAHRHTATSRTSRRRARLTLYTSTAYPYSPRALWAARRS